MTSPSPEAMLKAIELANRAIEYAENGRHQNGLYNGEVAAIARALISAQKEVSTLREAAEKLISAYTAERDALYDCCTDSEGDYSEGDDGINDKAAVAEMDVIIDAAKSALQVVGSGDGG